MKSKIISVWIYRLITDIRFQLDLHNVFYIPSVCRNLISSSNFDLESFSFIFINLNFKLIKKFILIDTETLYNGLYKINLVSSFAQSLLILNVNIGMKHNIVNESSLTLQHR